MWQTNWLVATSWDILRPVIWSGKYENAMPETSENVILHQIIYLYLGNYSMFSNKFIST